MDHNGDKLSQEIVAMSVADDWETARAEWSLAEVFRAEQPQTCLCGHTPIIECCVIHNRLNDAIAIVGNVCIAKFGAIKSEALFRAVERITKDISKAVNVEMLNWARGRNWIGDWEELFYLNTMRRPKLTSKQRAKRVEINEQILMRFRATGQGGEGGDDGSRS